MIPSPFAVAGLLVVVALGLLLRRERRARRTLARQLENTSLELQSLQGAFSRFAPEGVVDRVIAHGVESHGEKKEATALFADLIGFTTLSENIEPTVLVRILNGYFERMSGAIADHRGYVSTLIGDGILALFGALEPNPWQVDDAARAALAMHRELAVYNGELAAEGLPTLSVGIGLHYGPGVAGLVGSRELMQFTLVGRTVNVAARAQELTRQYGERVIATEAVRTRLGPSFQVRDLPATAVKGVQQPLVIFALDGDVAS